MEPSEWQNREGIELQPLDALDYFSDPQPVQHLQLSWHQDCADLMRLAPAVREALASGSFMPDYEKWKAGEIGWKLQLPEELQALRITSRIALDSCSDSRVGGRRRPHERQSAQARSSVSFDAPR